MSYSPFEAALIRRGGSAARIAEKLYTIRTRAKTYTPKPKPKPRRTLPLPAGIDPSSKLGKVLTGEVKVSGEKKPTSTSDTTIRTVSTEQKVDLLTDPNKPPESLSQVDLRTLSPSVVDTSNLTAPPALNIPESTYPTVHGTATPEQLTEGEGGFVPQTGDTGFYKPSVIEERRDRMALEKGHTIGRDPDTHKPITVHQTEASYFHKYEPGFDDPTVKKTYTDVETNIQKNLLIAQSNITVAKQAQENIPVIEGFIKQLENAPANTLVTYTEVSTTGEETIHKDVSPAEALPFFRSHLSDLKDNADQLSTSEKDLQSIENQQSIIGGYKKYGYVLKKTDTGYIAEEPKSKDVFFWKHGEEKGSTLLASASLMSSPLGIQSVGAGVQEAVTGDEKVREAELERLSKYALGLDVSLKKGDYFAHVIGSPAMLEGVYLPILTLGTSKVLSIGISGAAPYIASGAGKISTTFGKAIPTTMKLVASDVAPKAKFVLSVTGRAISTPVGKQTMKYGIYFGLEGKKLLTTITKHPEMFGGVAARSLFNWELQWAAMEKGFKGTEFKPKKDWVEKDILKTKGLPASVREQKIIGRVDVAHKSMPKTKTDLGTIYYKDTSKFGAKGELLVKTEGTKPVNVLVEAHGKTKSYPSFKYSESEGSVMFKWGEKKGFTIYDYMGVRKFESSGVEVFKLGKKRTISSIETTMGKIEPHTGSSISDVLRLGQTEKTSLDIYFSKGKYSNIIEDVVGEHRITGLIYGLKESKATMHDFGSGLIQKLSTVLKTKPVVPSIKLLVTKPVETIATGVSISVSKTIQDTATKPVVTETKISKTSLKDAGISTDYSSGIILAKPKDTKMELISTQMLVTGDRSKSDMRTILDTKELLDTKEHQLTGTGLIYDTKTDLDTLDNLLHSPIQIPYMGTSQTQRQGLLSKSMSESLLETKTDLTMQLITQVPEIIIPHIITPIIPTIDEDSIKKEALLVKTTGDGYDVYVKERSMYHGKIVKPTKFKQVNTNALTREKALGLGATIADESAAISFKIVPSNEKATEPLLGIKSFKELEHKFTKKGEVYIEKNKFRLDTPGEQRQISLLGRQSKKKNMLNIGKGKKGKRKKNVRYI